MTINKEGRMKEWIIRTLIKAWLPGYELAPPGTHVHKNPVKTKRVYREVKLEDVQDMVVEQLKARGEKDAI
jgi:hypothetical protein